MRRFSRNAVLGLLAWGLAASTIPAAAGAETADCAAAVALLEEQNGKFAGELRGIRREIAALRADLEQPGVEEVFSGMGYILGLFGTAAFVASRRKG